MRPDFSHIEYQPTPPTAAPKPREWLAPEHIARAVMWAVSQPPHVDVNEILIRPTAQDG